jgi:hypothetical protein
MPPRSFSRNPRRNGSDCVSLSAPTGPGKDEMAIRYELRLANGGDAGTRFERAPARERPP